MAAARCVGGGDATADSFAGTMTAMKTWMKWAIAAVVVVLLGVVGGPFIYINFIKDDPPDRFELEAASDATTATVASAPPVSAPATGGTTWTVEPATSAVGYRVVEVLFGQDTEGVGRTSAVTGEMTLEGTQVTAASFEVDMTTVTSDEDRRDNQFRGRLMDTATFPTSTFVLTTPIELGSVPADGEEVTHTVTGDLTLRGVTKSVTFDLTARRNGASIEANGSILINFDDYEIPDASGGPASVGRDGELELLLVFAR